MIIRSWLFVPGDSDKKLEKARTNPADALLLDLEDAVADDRQEEARAKLVSYLQDRTDRSAQQLWVRINPMDSPLSLGDLAAVMQGAPDGKCLPKPYSAADINKLADYLSALETREGLPLGSTKIICVATETADALLRFESYLEGVSERLVAMTWGAEDLMAALGATENRIPGTKQYDAPFMLARSLTLAAARAIDAQPVGGVYTDFRDDEGLAEECAHDRRNGFVGKLAIHPGQVEIINQAFTPSDEEIDWSRQVVDAFESNPGVGATSIDGKMLDMPHLKQARQVLALAEELAARS
ncbi:MAG: CoA ester lyase [Pseudomonadota bacterium]